MIICQDQFSPVLKSHMLVLEDDISWIFTHDIYLLTRDQIIFESKFSVAGRIVNEDSGAIVVTITQYGKLERKWNMVYQLDKLNPTFACSCKLFVWWDTLLSYILCHESIERDKISSIFGQEEVDQRRVSDWKIREHGRWEVCADRKVWWVDVDVRPSLPHCLKQWGRVWWGEGCGKPTNYWVTHVPQPTDTDPKDPERGIDISTGLHRNVITDLVPCRSKGMKRNSGSGKQNKKKKKRRCGECRQYGHNKRSCSKHGMKGKIIYH